LGYYTSLEVLKLND